jgi:hypothetical protein
MITSANSGQKIKDISFTPLFRMVRLSGFLVLAGTILSFTGMAEIIGGMASVQLLDMPDPIFRLSVRHLMLTFGSANICVASLCLFTGKRSLSLGLVAWISTNFMVYRIGLWSIGWRHACGFMIAPLGLSLITTDIIFSLSSACLLVGSLAMFWLDHQARCAVEHLKMSCPACGIHIKFARQNLGQKIPCPHCQTSITLRKPDLLKMACFFCKEHIEFPPHAIGEKMPCPHCKMDITLREPA